MTSPSVKIGIPQLIVITPPDTIRRKQEGEAIVVQEAGMPFLSSATSPCKFLCIKYLRMLRHDIVLYHHHDPRRKSKEE